MLGEREKPLGGRPIIICPTCRCDFVIFVRKPCFERNGREFGEAWLVGGGGGDGEGGDALKRKEGREKRTGRWDGVSGTAVKWLRCYHGDSHEGSQDTPGG